ncbi:protein tyrosine phosphatase [Rhodococcus sp. SRB_17]|uniref:tyrosine-protein phosphatase n=1 Tax=Rhodococcus sp. OK302 TaxID=1882769 RepID=UPI000B945C2D|nr:tyrosine-protein phosphatase [Rhodococcus sp. OK302]NMM87228.1 protein tyrosine phosphatase [Rhodococcus sp. SRB_17]OYD70006.1 protein-tyrosine phosphatase [Rhodococcus sp. OK302]
MLPNTTTPTATASGNSTPRLESIHNFRDVAGHGYSTETGSTMRRGVFYRANVITPTPADLAVVESLGLTAIYDVRSEAEVTETPDTVPSAATYTNIPILPGTIQDSAMSIRTIDAAQDFMRLLNRSFITDNVTRAGFGQLLTALATTPGPQLFHCTAGKDRTGWASALLQTLAGVPRETIFDDYLLTNTYSGAYVEATAERIAKTAVMGRADVVRVMLTVDESYLGAAFEQVEADYSSIENYLHSGLGLTADTIEALEAKLIG